MRCPQCKSDRLSVIASRKEYQTFNHRYLVCEDCHVSFQTIEKIIEGTICNVPSLFEENEEKSIEDVR